MNETVAIWLAWHVIPAIVRKWVVVRAFAEASKNSPSRASISLTYGEVMKNFK